MVWAMVSSFAPFDIRPSLVRLRERGRLRRRQSAWRL